MALDTCPATLPHVDEETVEPQPAPAVALGTAPATTRKTSEPALRYMGFRNTAEGREYTLRLVSLVDKREFVVLIAHASFGARLVSFQDAPLLCFAKVKRELTADFEFQPEGPFRLSDEELASHRLAIDKAAAPHRRPRPASSSPMPQAQSGFESAD